MTYALRLALRQTQRTLYARNPIPHGYIVTRSCTLLATSSSVDPLPVDFGDANALVINGAEKAVFRFAFSPNNREQMQEMQADVQRLEMRMGIVMMNKAGGTVVTALQKNADAGWEHGSKSTRVGAAETAAPGL